MDGAPLVAIIGQALSALAGEDAEASDQDARVQANSRSLRIDTSKIDTLIDLAAELLVAKNGLAHLVKQVDAKPDGHELPSIMRRQHDAIARIANELRAAVPQLRMEMPIAIVSANVQDEIITRARELNAAFVAKPLTDEALGAFLSGASLRLRRPAHDT